MDANKEENFEKLRISFTYNNNKNNINQWKQKHRW